MGKSNHERTAMNPFIHPEFWLSLAFFIVLALLLFSPIRKIIHQFLIHEQQKIENQIAQAQALLKDAKTLYKEMQKKAILKGNNSTNNQIKLIQKEFDEKIKARTDSKIQEFQMRQKMAALQMKNHLRKSLLDQAEASVFKTSSSAKTLKKDMHHFVEVLHKNKDYLSDSFT